MQKEREAGEVGMAQEELRDRCVAAVEEWKVATSFMEMYNDGHRELTMGWLWVQWVAREAYGYNKRASN